MRTLPLILGMLGIAATCNSAPIDDFLDAPPKVDSPPIRKIAPTELILFTPSVKRAPRVIMAPQKNSPTIDLSAPLLFSPMPANSGISPSLDRPIHIQLSGH